MNKPSTILLADDDQDDLMLLADALKAIAPCFTYVEKPDGREAINYLTEAKESNKIPSLVVLDINMPIMDGREVLKFIKSDDTLKHIPVVVFSTSSTTRDIEYCESYGAELVTKPMFITELNEIAKKLIAHCRLSHERIS